MVQLLARRGGLPTAASRRSVDYTEHCADRELATELEPRIELLPRPPIHPDLTTLAALSAPDHDSAAGPVQIALLQRQRFADSQAGAPEENDQRAESMAVGAITECAHDCHDLFNRRWIGWVLLALVAGWTTSVIAGQGGGRTAVASDVEQHGFHESSLGGLMMLLFEPPRPERREAPAATDRLLLVSAQS
jgi:hypothetical protein